ncbi:MAG TPA: hypothetical protein VJ647_00635, partial [Chitinophagaceae bacterium]|nr:hypothetical protein [Chitinophagaceae bacterium]
MKCIFTFIALLCILFSYSQTKLWDGGGGSDNSWTNRFNWVGDIAPGSTDDILLDNSVISGSYTVTLPVISVTVKRLTITPSGENTIRLVIPTANTATPAFTASGPGYGILINRGGIFQNSSGLASGTSLVIIADSMRISNGGRYIHNTRSVHANIIQALSKAQGTENGTVEFDIPSGAGTLSMSNRTYGNLVLSSTAAGGARTYVASGSNSLTINGNMTINAGVTLSVDLSTVNGNIIVKGDLIQNGGTLNLAAGAGNVTILKVAGNITQATAGQITESNTGIPAIELNGVSTQNISLAGSITNDVGFIVNNPSGATLLSPLSLPYKLILQRGQLSTFSANLLTLQSTCTIQADSLSASFVNGPLRKEGLSSTSRFLFPVGKNNMHRWLELKNATGIFTVEYHRETPPYNYAVRSEIDHISGLEYWTVKADVSPAPSAIVKLSFDANSGGITDLSKLLVTRLSGEIWTSLGNVTTMGTAGTNGSATITIPISNFNATGDFFTLATDVSYANPLPLIDSVRIPQQAAQRNVLLTKLASIAPSII